MSPLLWTPPTPGDCRHGEPASTCPICHPDHSRLDEPAVRVLLVLLLAALLVFGRGSWDRELAFDDAVHQAHVAERP